MDTRHSIAEALQSSASGTGQETYAIVSDNVQRVGCKHLERAAICDHVDGGGKRMEDSVYGVGLVPGFVHTMSGRLQWFQ